MSGRMPQKLQEVTEEEERQLDLERKRRNKTTAVLLVVFVALVMFGSMFLMIQAGFTPLDNIDLFRSN